jgi:hypothetical protein
MGRTGAIELEPAPTRAAAGRRWLPLGGALGLGLAAGIALAIVTIILPRQHELSRTNPGSPFFRSFDPNRALHQVSPGIGASSHGADDRTGWGASRTFSRSWVIHCTAKAAEQQKLIGDLEGAIQAAVRSGGGRRTFVWGSSSSTQSYPGEVDITRKIDYQTGITSGAVHIWAIGRGDSLTIIVTITEI